METKKYFFGWTNIKWFIKEMVNLISNKESYFSKKKFESHIAFIVLEYGLLHWLVININTIKIEDLILWCTVNALISGYNIREIQKEKLTNN